MAAQSRTRLYAFVHIANIGLSAFPVGELRHPATYDQHALYSRHRAPFCVCGLTIP
jgi:predicted amidohydrolase